MYPPRIRESSLMFYLYSTVVLFLCALTVRPSSAQTQVALGLGAPKSLQIQGGNIFFADLDGTDGKLKMVPIQGGLITTLVSGASLFDTGNWRGLDDAYVFDNGWIFGGYGGYENHAIFRAPASGGSKTILTSNSGGVFIGVQAGFVYFGSSFQYIERLPETSGSPSTVLSGYWARASASDSTGIYFIEYFTTDLYRLSFPSLTLTMLASFSQEGSLFVDSQNVYVTVSGQIYVVPKTGGTATLLVESGTAQGSTSDGTSVYFVDAGQIRMVPIGGGGISSIYDLPPGRNVTSIAVTGSNIFWADVASGVPQSGRILALSLGGTPQFSVSPQAATDFASLVTGTTSDRSFVVRNGGTGSVSGMASTSSPFSVIGNANYFLMAGQSQTIVVRYSPVSPGTDLGHITFTGPTNQTRQLIGSAYAHASSDWGSIAGTVTNANTGVPIAGIKVSINGDGIPTDASGKYLFAK